MATRPEPQFTASIVISSEHAGLKPHFKELEDEIYHALARCPDARAAKLYLMVMHSASVDWRRIRGAAGLHR